MNYHNITKCDMNNGTGLRVVLWCSHCEHHCNECHNPQTWDEKSGIYFDENAKQELFEELSNDYISGITFSGGDPFSKINREQILKLCIEIKDVFPTKDIWLYTGYSFEDVKEHEIINFLDVLVDGKFEADKKNINYHWAGSTNQRVIDIQKSLKKGSVVELEI